AGAPRVFVLACPRHPPLLPTFVSWRRPFSPLLATLICLWDISIPTHLFTWNQRPAMQVWPAIDLRGGKCVRLQQGDYGRETVFGDDPAAMARQWVDAGAEHLHLVDLDGARAGFVENWAAIEAIVAAAGIPCELG